MEMSINVSNRRNRYVIFNIDDNWIFCDESISSVLGISLLEYKQRFKNICNIFDTEYGIIINDKISDEEIVERFKQEFSNELVILKMEGCNLKKKYF